MPFPSSYLSTEDNDFLESKPAKDNKQHSSTAKVSGSSAVKKIQKKPVEEVPVITTDPESLAPPAKDSHKSEAHKKVAEIEKRFLKVANLTGDLSKFPIDQSCHLQVKTNKSKSDEHGEVFTPLWLVDQMVERISDEEIRRQGLTTMDLCAGYGQFTLRLLRKKVSLLGGRFKVDALLEDTHAFVELQPSSCYKLLHIFGQGIRLCIGDASKLGDIPDEAEKGIWVLCEKSGKWKDMTSRVQRVYNEIENGSRYARKSINEKAERFETIFKRMQKKS